jgi:hypothetical protein
VLVAALASCRPHMSDQARHLVWAKAVSLRERNTQLGSTSRYSDELEHLRQRFELDEADLRALTAQAEREHWTSGPICRPAPAPYFQNGFLIAPETREPIVGRQSPRTCARGLEGIVIVDSVIRANGTATDPRILRSAAPELDEPAVAAVVHAHWLPALLCGRPVDVHFIAAVRFRLADCQHP